MTTIYALAHPETGVVRYVGKTSRTLAYRLKRHLGAAKYGARGHRNNWLRSLPVAPAILPMCVTEERYASAAERFAIALYRAVGTDLVNATDGGEGTQGPKTAEHLAALRGKPCPPHVRVAISAANRGNKAFLGRTHSPEARARMSAAKMGHKFCGNQWTRRLNG